MIRLTEIIGYPDLQYHIDNKLPLCENVYRYSSDSFLQLFREARELFDILSHLKVVRFSSYACTNVLR